MKEITDEYMQEMRAKTRGYTFLLLKPGPRRFEAGADKIIWEHGRRNHALRAEGILPIVCPIGTGEIAGIGIFDRTPEEADELMRQDPAVKAGVLVYSLYPCWSFPGDALPK
jgi:hypothetical protein